MSGGGGPAGGGGAPPFMVFGAPGGQGGGQGFDPFQMLFANGAPDPLVMEQLMAMGFPGFAAQAGQFQQQGAASNQPANHPTAESTLRSLPRVKVTSHDLVANQGSECSICLDEFSLGDPALRIFCGHLFHEDCVKDWLKKSNECPVCRFELPTDDAEHEKGRTQRMAGRKIRIRLTDLTKKTVQELQRLASFFGVDVRGCIEKKEIVDCIAASSKVEIIPADGEEAAGSSSAASPGLPRSSWIAGGVGGVAAERASAGGEAGAALPTSRHGDLTGKSISELRQIARRVGASLDGCLEKGEIVERILARPGPHG